MMFSSKLRLGVAAMALTVCAGSAQAYSLGDTYVGGDGHGYGDVIGYKSMFDVHGLDVSVTGTVVTVDISTEFWDDIGVYGGLTSNGKGIGVGDLMLSTSWNPSGSASDGYKSGNSSSGTVWSYGIAVDDAYSTTGGAATFYALSGASNSDNLLNSEDFLSRGTFRDGQAVAVDESSSTVAALSNAASWDVSKDKISFMFDAVGTDLLSGDMALHWSMLCGNDVIEGVAVSEPGTMALLGMGLLGLFSIRRRQLS